MTKAGLVGALFDAMGGDLTKSQLKSLLEAVATVAHKELKKTGVFVLPGFAKFEVKVKKGKPAGNRMNPFTKKEQFYPARPDSKTVRARPIKALKDAVG
ncbi:MAG: HU family DNA-binding protein [Deltaproteobacteria bacterium]|nr:HU family DNA-binding protein [Deltaproteobacteria bacterium]